MIILFLVTLIFVYLIGAVPTGYLFCKVFYGINISEIGSGNIGASNVARIKGKSLFFPIFFIDAGKAYLALYLVDSILNKFCGYKNLQGFIFVAAGVLLVANAYSVFIGFRGGKGVATSLGIIAYIFSCTFASVVAFLWLGIFAATKQAFIASIGSMFAALCMLLFFCNLGSGETFFLICLFLWLVFRHQGNIQKYF